MAVRPAPNPSDNVNAPLNACPWDRQAARRHARTVHPARSVPPAVPTPTAPVYCAPSLRSSAATAAALLTAGPHRLASPPGSLLCSSPAAPFPLGDGVVGTTHSQAGREPPLPIQISTFGGTLPKSAQEWRVAGTRLAVLQRTQTLSQEASCPCLHKKSEYELSSVPGLASLLDRL